jgi:ABC-2 type transport system ATP-binding protein
MLEAANLTKKFNGFTAVDNISFTVNKGEIFAFLGPNGAGKTTTIKIFTTLAKPTAGEAMVNGFDAAREPGRVRSSFGIVFQDPSLDDELTAWDNLIFHGAIYGLSRAERRQRAEEMLGFVELLDRRAVRVKNFSGGMKRRLEIARGLMHRPEVLFLDEPTQGLDPQTRNHIWQYIQGLNREFGLTVFFTTHYMEEAERYAGRVAVIDHGRIVAKGSPDELKKAAGAANLEEAFLNLTGSALREEEVSSLERMRDQRKKWHR